MSVPSVNRLDVRRAARKLVRSMPAPIPTTVSNAYRSRRPASPPPPRHFDFPPIVANAEQLRAYLADTDIFGEAQSEANGYLADAFERFRITMSLIPNLPKGARILELGSNPYLITKLLLDSGYDVTCANWFGEKSGFGTRGSQVIRAPHSGTQTTFEFDHFNVEEETFPYDENSFDLVLFCEIIEHLPNDPIHVLAEIHRVLRQPDGIALITTPNAARLDNLRKMMAGDNVYEELSGYGTYGRHNREYTVAELRVLIADCGFEIDQLFAADIHPHAADEWPLAASVDLADRGDNLFLTARPHGNPRWRYPRWLYSSQHALRKIVRADLAMGFNCDLQASGFYDLEQDEDGFFRWMGANPQANVLVCRAPGDDKANTRIRIAGIAPPPTAGNDICLEVTAIGYDSKFQWTIPCDGKPFSVESEVVNRKGVDWQGDCELTFTTDRTWSPAEQEGSSDSRRLSVAIRSVALG